jgi:putative transposase
LTPHASFLALGRDDATRAAAYRQRDDLTTIRDHLQQERALGDRRFQKMVEKALNRRVACKPIGRPRVATMK